MISIKKLLPTLLISIFISGISYGQFRPESQNSLRDQINDARHSIKSNPNNLEYIKGSPYTNETFEVVTIKRFNNAIYSARYDANLGEMQIKRDNDTIVLNNSENFEITFALSRKVYKTHSYTNKDGSLKRGFLVVLREADSLAVLKEEVIKFYEEKPATGGYDKAKPAEFRKLSDVYYIRLDDKVSLLPQKRKDFLKLFPEHSNKLKVFIKKNKISLKKDDDLITLFKYIETL